MTLSKIRLPIILFLWSYCSIALFYDFRILDARGLISGFSISNFFIVWAALLLPFISYFITKLPNDRRLSSFYILYFFYITLSLFVGLLRSNPMIDVVSDLYKSLFILAGLGLYNITKHNTVYFYGLVTKILLVFSILRLGVFIYFGTSFNQLYYGTVYDTLLIGFSLVYIASMKIRDTDSPFKRKLMGALAAALVLLGQKKLVLVSLLVYIISLFRNIWGVILGFIGIFVVSIFYQEIILFLEGTRLRTLLNYNDLLYAEAQRVEEIQTSFAHWTRSWVSIIFGDGFGTNIKVYSYKEGYVIDLHSIHNTAIVTALRSGITGLLLLAVLAWQGLRTLLFNPEKRLVAAIIVAAFVASQFSYTFMDEVFVGYIFAQLKLGGAKIAQP